MGEWPPLHRTLSPAAFYSLYRGALAAESVQRRLSRCYVVTLAGRLGLRPGEILHCHEGWVDWGRGELAVPALDPCACEECWAAARARRAAGDERPVDEILRTELWSSPSDAGARTVAFGWSERLTGLLSTVFDYMDHLDGDRALVRELVRETAADAEGVDPGGLSPTVLRATGGRFFAEVGFDATSIQHLLGLAEREPAEAFVRDAGQRTSAALYSVFDRDAVGPDVPPSDPSRKFPVVADPAPFSREPFTASDYGPETRSERAKNEAGQRVRNPRPATVPDAFEYDPERHRTREQADGDGGQFSRSPGADAADMAALRDWIVRKDASLRPDSDNGDSGGDPTVAPGMDHGRVREADGPAVADGPPAEPEGLDPPGSARAPGPGPGPDPDSQTPSPSLQTQEPETVTEATTDPLVARVTTRLTHPDIENGALVEGQVILGQEELLFVAPPTDGDLEGTSFVHVPLDVVADVVPDARPDRLPDEVDSTLGIAWDGPDGRTVGVVELDGQRRADFRLALFRNALHVSQMQVTHPAKVGGRVTDESATPSMLYLDRERVRFTPLGSDTTMVDIDLVDVLHVERTRQAVGGERRPLDGRQTRPGATGDARRLTVRQGTGHHRQRRRLRAHRPRTPRRQRPARNRQRLIGRRAMARCRIPSG